MKRYARMLPLIGLLLLLSLVVTAPAAAQTGIEANKALAERYNDWWPTGDLELASEIIAPGFVAHFINGTSEDWPAYVTNTVMPTRIMFPDMTIKPMVTIAEGDMVAIAAIWGGTFSGGEEFGLTPTNKAFWVNDLAFYRIENGRIAEFWDGTNVLSSNRQMGVVPVEGAVVPDKNWEVSLGKTSLTPNDQRALLWDYFMAINGRDYTMFDKCLGENMVNYWAPYDVTIEGLAGVKEAWKTVSLSHRIAPEMMVVEGDLAAVHFTMFPANDANPSIIQPAIGLASLYRFDNGKIVNEWAIWDEATVLQHLPPV